jgi:hypothetical protein
LPDVPKARILAAHDSDPLPVVLRDMMKYSTNMTAEAVGMAASLAQGVVGHEASAAAMTHWIATRTGLARRTVRRPFGAWRSVARDSDPTWSPPCARLVRGPASAG